MPYVFFLSMANQEEATDVSWGWLPVLLCGLLIPVALFIYTRRKLAEARLLVRPLRRFLIEFSRGASPGHDQALFRLFSPDVLQRVERALIRAMARCVVAELGTYVSVATSSLTVRRQTSVKYGTLLTADATAKFSNRDDVAVTVTWIEPISTSSRQDGALTSPTANSDGSTSTSTSTNSKYTPGLLVSFDVQPRGADSKPLNVLKYVVAREFEPYGERFIASLMTRTPTFAYENLHDSLKSRYPSEESVAAEVIKVMRAAGGLKEGNSMDSQLTDAKLLHLGGDPAKPVSGVALEFTILGSSKDLHAELRIVFVAMQCRVSRFALKTVSGSGPKHFLVDGDTNKIIDASS